MRRRDSVTADWLAAASSTPLADRVRTYAPAAPLTPRTTHAGTHLHQHAPALSSTAPLTRTPLPASRCVSTHSLVLPPPFGPHPHWPPLLRGYVAAGARIRDAALLWPRRPSQGVLARGPTPFHPPSLFHSNPPSFLPSPSIRPFPSHFPNSARSQKNQQTKTRHRIADARGEASKPGSRSVAGDAADLLKHKRGPARMISDGYGYTESDAEVRTSISILLLFSSPLPHLLFSPHLSATPTRPRIPTSRLPPPDSHAAKRDKTQDARHAEPGHTDTMCCTWPWGRGAARFDCELLRRPARSQDLRLSPSDPGRCSVLVRFAAPRTSHSSRAGLPARPARTPPHPARCAAHARVAPRRRSPCACLYVPNK
ncbi:hypothetical protein C8R47DRAFT_1221758 [Mycena vitilis]|nr:hypothetical protein C8R47DRAFT_1221758 [Mycena vitilis]